MYFIQCNTISHYNSTASRAAVLYGNKDRGGNDSAAVVVAVVVAAQLRRAARWQGGNGSGSTATVAVVRQQRQCDGGGGGGVVSSTSAAVMAAVVAATVWQWRPAWQLGGRAASLAAEPWQEAWVAVAAAAVRRRRAVCWQLDGGGHGRRNCCHLRAATARHCSGEENTGSNSNCGGTDNNQHYVLPKEQELIPEY